MLGWAVAQDKISYMLDLCSELLSLGNVLTCKLSVVVLLGLEAEVLILPWLLAVQRVSQPAPGSAGTAPLSHVDVGQ